MALTHRGVGAQARAYKIDSERSVHKAHRSRSNISATPQHLLGLLGKDSLNSCFAKQKNGVPFTTKSG